MLALKTVMTLAVFWHTIAYAAGGVHVVFSYQSLFNNSYVPRWGRVIRSADWQLWVSGVVVIGLGSALSDFGAYVANPKLWTKALVIVVWCASTQVIRRYGGERSGRRRRVLPACAINLACWIYGGFLGVAKPLAFGVIPFPVFVGGFAIVCIACLGMTMTLERRRLHIEGETPTSSMET